MGKAGTSSYSIIVETKMDYLYNNGKVSVCLSVCACVRVCVTNFQSNPYLCCFKLEFEAVKDKLGLLIM